jgi:TatD DNase family protein
MIDTHAHLDFENFDEDREEVISRAFDNGVKKIINIGVDLKTSKRSIEIAEGHENIFAAIGFHPEFFAKDDWGDRGKWVDDLKRIAASEKVVAIGECGLDYSRIGESGKIRERQKKGFLAQIEIARELNLPVIVHCRNAWSDLYEIVKSQCQNPNVKQNSQSKVSKKIQDTKLVLHCYSGRKEDTEKFLKLPNTSFSFSGNITYPKPIERTQILAQAIRMVPLERIMLDSDSPFLAPQEMRGKRNEPVYIKYIAEKIAEIKGISVSKIEKATDESAEKFFGIGLAS